MSERRFLDIRGKAGTGTTLVGESVLARMIQIRKRGTMLGRNPRISGTAAKRRPGNHRRDVRYVSSLPKKRIERVGLTHERKIWLNDRDRIKD